MRNGPSNQFCKSDSNSTFQSLNTRHISSYFTFANGGYIMTINPIAIGMDVVPIDMDSNASPTLGMVILNTTPIPIATNIQRVR